jgi:hypothetical protein
MKKETSWRAHPSMEQAIPKRRAVPPSRITAPHSAPLPRESSRRCRISSTSCSENWCSTPPEVSLSLDGVSSLILPMVVFSAPPPRSQHRQDYSTNGGFLAPVACILPMLFAMLPNQFAIGVVPAEMWPSFSACFPPYPKQCKQTFPQLCRQVNNSADSCSNCGGVRRLGALHNSLAHQPAHIAPGQLQRESEAL